MEYANKQDASQEYFNGEGALVCLKYPVTPGPAVI